MNRHTKQPVFLCYLLKVMTIKHKLFFSLFLVLFLTTPLPYLFSPSQRMTWLVQPRPHSIVQFHTCLLYWHLSEHIFPEHFPSHYSAFPLQQYAVFNLPFVSRFLAWGSEYNNDVRFFCLWPIICCILTHATKFILEIDQGLKKKKVALHINI